MDNFHNSAYAGVENGQWLLGYYKGKVLYEPTERTLEKVHYFLNYGQFSVRSYVSFAENCFGLVDIASCFEHPLPGGQR